MAPRSKNKETELSQEETEDLRAQGDADEELEQQDTSTDVEDEQDPDDDAQIDETQREEERAAEEDARKRGQVKQVPHQALHEERERRKEYERQNRELSDRYSRLEGRFQQILDTLKQPQSEQEQEQPPDPETQPFDYIRWQQKQIEDLRGRIDGREKQTEKQSQIDGALEYGNSLASQFRAKVGAEEYDAAFQFMYNLRGGELEDMGYQPHQVRVMLQREIQSGILTALQNGVNPGEMLWKMAQRRGYRPQTKQKKLENVEEGQRRSMSLGGGAQRKLATPGSVEDINAMSDDDFARWVAKYGNKGLRKAFLGEQ